MDNTYETFLRFMDDPEAREMYITGGAGTGKTTTLGNLVEWCIDNDKGHIACAFTHKAVAVLKSKMPPRANLATLHKFLTKVPTTNMMALRLNHVDGNAVVGLSELMEVIFIDEFSMIGKKDYDDIKALQLNDEQELITKVVYIGDRNQLPPVKDQQAVNPCGDYVVHLTKVHRQADDSELLDTLIALQSYIEGRAKPAPLVAHSSLVRGKDLAKMYKSYDEPIILAYTNKAVEQWNATIQGRDKPLVNDMTFSPTTRIQGKMLGYIKTPDLIKPIFGDFIDKKTKYNPLATLKLIPAVQFVLIEEPYEQGDMPIPRAIVFGHKKYQLELARLKKLAVDANRRAASLAGGEDRMMDWAYQNPTHKIARERSHAWKEFLSFAKCVICLDFNHAMTVHKSQGSTYDTVLIDTQDLSIAMRWDYKYYLRLIYVAVSRASNLVITN